MGSIRMGSTKVASGTQCAQAIWAHRPSVVGFMAPPRTGHKMQPFTGDDNTRGAAEVVEGGPPAVVVSVPDDEDDDDDDEEEEEEEEEVDTVEAADVSKKISCNGVFFLLPPSSKSMLYF